MTLSKNLVRRRPVKHIFAAGMAVAMASVIQAAIVGPYPVDGNTLHLWHFDETGATPANAPTNALAFDAITNNPQTSSITLSNTPGPVNENGFPGYPPNNFALQGQTSYSYPGVADYGDCVETTNFSCLLPTDWIQPNPITTTVIWLAHTNLNDFISTNTGAFTFEANVKLLVNPLTAGRNMEIICGDSGFAYRAWQFRINAAGQLEFNMNINAPAGVVHDVFKTLPSTGPDAVNVGQWYHTAVTYTGISPTNGDTASQVRLYWTLMDPTRTNADVLLLTNVTAQQPYGFTNAATVILGIGGSARGNLINNVGNSEGFVGYIDEVRISAVARKSTEMAFNTNVFNASPVINVSPAQTNQLVGYGQTLAIAPSETGSIPITNQWYQNGVALAGQTNLSLVISNVTFAAAGNYQLNATNAAGSTNSVVCSVTVGAAFNGLFNTGVDANGNGSAATAPGSVDLHYQLVQSADPNTVNANAIVWGSNPNGGSVNNNVSGWIGSQNGGSPPVGTYSYQTEFQIDNGDVASASLTGRMWAGGPSANTVQAFLNGVETDFTLQPNSASTAALFFITNGLQTGSNILVFTLNDSSGNFVSAMRAELTGIGNALPPGLPTFSSQPPASETVQYGATTVLPVVALGRPPLTYQWLSNGVPISPAAIPSATGQYFTFGATNVNLSQIVGGSFTANYQVVVSNDSGSVTSSVTALTIQIPPLTLALAGEPIWNPLSNETNVIVVFSDAVDPITATTAGNYSLDNSATVTAAAMGDLPNKVILTTSVLNPATTYTLSVQNVKDSFGQAMSPSSASVPVGLYPVCALWIRADTGVTTDANGVNQWNDMSGNGNNLTQPFGPPYEPQLVANALNGMPVIHFTATNETYMSANDAPSLELTGDMSIFAVANFASLAGNTNGMIVSKTTANQPGPYDYYSQSGSVTFLRGNGAQSAAANSARAPAVGFAHILDVTMQGTNVTQRLDGNTNGASRLSTTIADTAQPLYLGTRVDQHNRLNGDLAELIVLSSIPSSNDVAMLENYLATEYHVPTGLNSYPNITQQPVASTNVSQGSTLMVVAAASGNPAVAYQWYDTNNLAIAGQTNATLVISNVQASDSYYLQATNIFGSATSTAVSVNTITGLNVGLAPASVAIYAGQTYTYSAVALGTVPLHYQWFQGASPIPNATNASYSAVASLGSTSYSCTVTNAYNGYSSTNAGPVTLTGVAAPTNLYQAAVLGNQPVAYWQLTEVPDNGSGNNGTIAYDYVGGHNGAYNNVVLGFPGFSSISSTDKAVQVGSFAASNSYAREVDQSSSGVANVNFAAPSGGNAELSVEAWVIVTNTTETAGAGIVTKGYGNGGEQFDLDYNSGFRFFVRDASGSVHAAASPVTLTANTWYHLVGVWDGANGSAYLYINGVTNAVSTGTPAGVGLLTAATTNTALPGAALVSIGARTSAQSVNNYDLQFKGRIDDVAIYNYVLTPIQVRADYVAGVKNAIFSASPTNILFSVAGTNLTLAWPVNHFGWRLLAQTNSLTKGLGTNWATVANSSLTNAVIVPINRNNGSVFYQLTYP